MTVDNLEFKLNFLLLIVMTRDMEEENQQSLRISFLLLRQLNIQKAFILPTKSSFVVMIMTVRTLLQTIFSASQLQSDSN
jgi:hypothetical protein